jgi:hypothetical protein
VIEEGENQMWTKEMHKRAKAEGKSLISLAVYGKYAKQSSFTFCGPATPEMVKVIDKALLSLSKLIRKKDAKESSLDMS